MDRKLMHNPDYDKQNYHFGRLICTNQSRSINKTFFLLLFITFTFMDIVILELQYLMGTTVTNLKLPYLENEFHNSFV